MPQDQREAALALAVNRRWRFRDRRRRLLFFFHRHRLEHWSDGADFGNESVAGVSGTHRDGSRKDVFQKAVDLALLDQLELTEDVDLFERVEESRRKI